MSCEHGNVTVHSSSSLRPHIVWAGVVVRVFVWYQTASSSHVRHSSRLGRRSSCVLSTQSMPHAVTQICVPTPFCHARRRSISCVVSKTESVTLASLSSSPTFIRLVLFQVTKCVMWAPTCMSLLYPVTYSSLLCVSWHRGSFIRRIQ